MTSSDLLQQLHALGVLLTPSPDGTLHYKAPKGTLTSALLDAMRQHKDALHAMMEAVEERAGIAEYDGGLPRAEAERLAWDGILGIVPTVEAR